MTVAVDLDVVVEAFEDATPELNYFVDRETGEVILVSETLGFIEAGQQRAEMAEHPGRYLPVPVAGQSDLVDDLEAFIDALDDENAQAALEDALDAPDVAARLSRALANLESVQAHWAAFRRDRFRARAMAWASSTGVTLARS